MKKCNSSCVFFPQEPKNFDSQIIDEFGIRKRFGVKRYCGFSGDLIKSWDMDCPYSGFKVEFKD